MVPKSQNRLSAAKFCYQAVAICSDSKPCFTTSSCVIPFQIKCSIDRASDLQLSVKYHRRYTISVMFQSSSPVAGTRGRCGFRRPLLLRRCNGRRRPPLHAARQPHSSTIAVDSACIPQYYNLFYCPVSSSIQPVSNAQPAKARSKKSSNFLFHLHNSPKYYILLGSTVYKLLFIIIIKILM